MSYEPIKEETKEQYLKIWSHYAIGHLNQEQLAKLFNCSQDTVSNAITWCAKNRVQFSPFISAEAAKESLEARLRELRNDLVKIKETKPANWNAAIGINRLIQENEELLWQFQSIVKDKNQINSDTANMTWLADMDYKSRLQYELDMEENRKVRDTVHSWSDEKKRLFLTLMEAMDSNKKVTIDKKEGITIIKIED